MWKPVINDINLSNLIHKKLNEILESINTIRETNSSLLTGQSGIVLLKSYYSRFTQNDSSNCEENVQILFDYFEQPDSLSYSAGVTGVLHTLHHLEKEDFFDFDNDIKDFDHSIFEDYISEEKTLDYLHGNSGVILSFLEQNIDSKYDYLFEKWLETIEKTREDDNENLKWKIDLIVDTDVYEKGYCLGLAHGFPSILIILLKLYERNKSDKVLYYIQQCVHFIMNSQLDDTTDFYFPSQIINNIKTGSRLAWCYGDLGVAYSIFLYGKYFNKNDITSFAIETFTKHTSKRDCITYGVTDADFCHGSTGIAHIYSRMYNHTNIELFRETAEYWYKTTLDKAIYPDGLAGYKHSQGPHKPLLNEYGLLEGISGIGLSLISAISTIEPKWDNTFLLS